MDERPEGSERAAKALLLQAGVVHQALVPCYTSGPDF
jgi:hypothetical protein